MTYYNEIIDYSDYKSLNISWGIIDEMRAVLFEYLIIVRNSSRFCIYSINFQCDNCQPPWNLVNLIKLNLFVNINHKINKYELRNQ